MGDVEPFLRENDNLSPVCRASLLEIFDDPITARDLDIELAAMIDAGKHFVQATYYLEGDGQEHCSRDICVTFKSLFSLIFHFFFSLIDHID